jgi:hypothetical protein
MKSSREYGRAPSTQSADTYGLWSREHVPSKAVVVERAEVVGAAEAVCGPVSTQL